MTRDRDDARDDTGATPAGGPAGPVPLIDSPCVRLCMLHPETGLCVGCARSGEEIAAWPRMTPEARRAVMATLSGRQAVPAARRGGRAGRQDRGLPRRTG